MKKLLSLLLCIIFLTSCQNASKLPLKNTPVSSNNTDISTISSEEVNVDSSGKLIKYSDLRKIPVENDSFSKSSIVFNESEYVKGDITSYTFNEAITFKNCEDYQKEIMETGKDPGLGIRSLHKQGITGKGVNVAIIDQNLLLNHPEFKDKIVKYFDSGCESPKNRGSMHAPAVASLLVGDSLGVAPNAKIYFAAAPSWKKDSKYFAECLNWIIEENKKLPSSQKIRVVSVSAAPSGKFTEFEKNKDMWDDSVAAAKKEGILVIDCTFNEEGFILPGFFPDFLSRETPDNLSLGFHQTNGSDLIAKLHESKVNFEKSLIVPVSSRTVAEQYYEGEYGYTYCGVGGLSWGIPYAAGVLALGWQVNPKLEPETIKDLLLKSAYVDENKLRYIDPVSFIAAARKTVLY